MATKRAGVSIIKQFYHDKPEIVACLALVGLSTVLLGAGAIKHLRDPSMKNIYKWSYKVVRKEDVDTSNPRFN